jgi:hypothetical protein
MGPAGCLSIKQPKKQPFPAAYFAAPAFAAPAFILIVCDGRMCLLLEGARPK